MNKPKYFSNRNKPLFQETKYKKNSLEWQNTIILG